MYKQQHLKRTSTQVFFKGFLGKFSEQKNVDSFPIILRRSNSAAVSFRKHLYRWILVEILFSKLLNLSFIQEDCSTKCILKNKLFFNHSQKQILLRRLQTLLQTFSTVTSLQSLLHSFLNLLP